MEATIYNQKGKEAGTIVLPEAVFGLKWNADLVHQVVTSMQSNARAGTADTRGRGEVRGGGKKPWRQKGTGRARHGSTRSPIWKGGGVTHGPLAEKDYSRKINKKMKQKALFTVLSEKNRKGGILFIDSLALSEAKTKNADAVIKALSAIKGYEKLSYSKANTILLASPVVNESIQKSFRNLKNVTLSELKNISPVDVLAYRFIVIQDPKMSMEVLETKITKVATKKAGVEPKKKASKKIAKA